MYGITQRRQVSMNRSSQSPAMSCSTTSAWLAMMRSSARSAIALVGVLLAVDRGQQLVEPVGGARGAHASSPPRAGEDDVARRILDAWRARREARRRAAPGRAAPGRRGRAAAAAPASRPASRSTFGRSRSAGRFGLELVDVREQHAGDVLDHAVEVAEVDRRPERDGVEVEPAPRTAARTAASTGAATCRSSTSTSAADEDRERRVVREAQPVVRVARGRRGSRPAGAGRRRRRSRRAGPATVRWIARSRPSQTQVACAFATSPDARTRSSKSRSETARPNVRTVVGRVLAGVSIVSGSAPPRGGERVRDLPSARAAGRARS